MNESSFGIFMGHSVQVFSYNLRWSLRPLPVERVAIQTAPSSRTLAFRPFGEPNSLRKWPSSPWITHPLVLFRRWSRWSASKKSTSTRRTALCAPIWTWIGPTLHRREASSTACSEERQVLVLRQLSEGEGAKVLPLFPSFPSSPRPICERVQPWNPESMCSLQLCHP